MSVNNKTTRLFAKQRTDLSPLFEDAEGKYYCVHRGTSMNPTLSRHDLLEITAYQNHKPQIGDVVLFLPPDEKGYFVHRIIKTVPKGFITRGDNNTDIDPWILNQKHLCGRVIATHQGKKKRKIAGGLMGRLTGLLCLGHRNTIKLTVILLGPIYRSLCSDGFLRWLIPFHITPKVATFQSNAIASHKLLLGSRIIGSYDESLLRWQIRRPYRMFIDESSLPKPQ